MCTYGCAERKFSVMLSNAIATGFHNCCRVSTLQRRINADRNLPNSDG